MDMDFHGCPGPNAQIAEYWRYCAPCNAHFSYERAYKRHITTNKAHTAPAFQCFVCRKQFTRDDDRKRHESRSQCRGSPFEFDLRSTAPRKRKLEDIQEDDDEDTAAQELHGSQFEASALVEDSATKQSAHTATLDTGVSMEGNSDPESIFAPMQQIWPDHPWDESSPLMDTLPDFETDMERSSPTLPELSRGNSDVSSHPATEPLTLEEENLDIVVPADDVREAGSPECEAAFALPNFDSQWTKPPKRKLNRSANRCTICMAPYETDLAQLQRHFDQHIKEQQGEHICSVCQVGFVHKADYERHIISVRNGHCGFSFVHAIPCTGHHAPPTSTESAVLADQDHFRFGFILRNWEQNQLQLHQASIQQLADVRDLTAGIDRLSLTSSKCPRSLATTFDHSQKTFRSEPHDHKPSARAIRSPRWNFFRRRSAKVKVLPGTDEANRQSRLVIDDVLSDFESPTSNDGPALHKACASGDVEQVRLLLQRGERISKRDKKMHTALHKSIIHDHADVTRLLLAQRKADVLLNLTLLHLAVQLNSLASAQALLDSGVDPNGRIMIAAIQFNQVVQDSNIPLPTFGETPLCRAARLGYGSMVKILLTAGSFIELSSDGYTPLGIAIANKHAATITILLQHGADPFEACSGNDNAFELALRMREPEILTILFQDATSPANALDLSQILRSYRLRTDVKSLLVTFQHWITAGPSSDSVSDLTRFADESVHADLAALLYSMRTTTEVNDNMVLFHASVFGWADLVRRLLNAGADMYDETHGHRRNAFFVAIKKRDLPIVQLFLEHGADANRPAIWCEHSMTPLYLAASIGFIPVISALLHSGAEVDGLVHGESPLFVACRNGHTEAIQLLLDRQADPFRPLMSTSECSNLFPRRSRIPQSSLVLAICEEEVAVVKHLMSRIVGWDPGNCKPAALFGCIALAQARQSSLMINVLLENYCHLFPQDLLHSLLASTISWCVKDNWAGVNVARWLGSIDQLLRRGARIREVEAEHQESLWLYVTRQRSRVCQSVVHLLQRQM